MKKKYVIHMGNAPDMVGGITTVINKIISTKKMPEYEFKTIYTVTTKFKVLKFIESIFKLSYLIILNKVEAVHLHMATRGSFYRKTILILILKIYKIPVILHSHGAEFQKFYDNLPRILKKYANYSLNKANAIIVLTDSWKEYYGNFIKHSDKIEVIGNFINLPKQEFDRNYNSNEVKILFLGRLGKRKGTYDLIDACEILKKEKINFVLVLAGDGEIEKCKSIIHEKELEKNIKIVGWISGERKVEYLKESDILTLPSYYESFGVALIEGMSYKLPIVASTGGQMYEVIRENIDGILIEPGNSLQLAEALKKLIEDSELRKKFGENGYTHVKECFIEQVIIGKYRDVYKRVIKSRIN